MGVEVLGAARGCTAVLQCVVDRAVRDMVKVVSWVQEPGFFIYPSLQGGNLSLNLTCIKTQSKNILFAMKKDFKILVRFSDLRFKLSKLNSKKHFIILNYSY